MKDPEYAHVKKKPEREATQRPPVRNFYFKIILYFCFLKVTPPRPVQPPKITVR